MVSRLRNGLAELFALPDGYEVLLGNGGTTVFWDAATFGLVESRAASTSSSASSPRSSPRSTAAAPHLERPDRGASPSPAPTPSPSPTPSVDVYALTHNETSTGVAMRDPPPRGRRAGPGARPRRRHLGRRRAPRSTPPRPTSTTSPPRSASPPTAGCGWPLSRPPPSSGSSGSRRRDRWVPASLDLTVALENSRKDQTYNTPALATLFLAVQQVEWICENGGLDWAAVALRPLGRDHLRLGRGVATTPPRSSPTRRTAATSWPPSTSTTSSTRRRCRRCCGPTASSTPRATASSAATSCASRCSPRSSPTTSPPSPPASTTWWRQLRLSRAGPARQRGWRSQPSGPPGRSGSGTCRPSVWACQVTSSFIERGNTTSSVDISSSTTVAPPGRLEVVEHDPAVLAEHDPRRPAAADRERLARHLAAAVAQPGHERGHGLGRVLGLEQLGHRPGREGAGEAGPRRRHDRVHPDAVAAALAGQRPGEPVEGRLGRRVGRGGRRAEHRRGGGHHDPAAAPLDQVRPRRAGDRHRALEGGVDGGPPLLDGVGDRSACPNRCRRC